MLSENQENRPIKDEGILSIGVPVRNSEDTLVATLSSLQNQTYRNFNVLISVDPSDDLTLKICREFVTRNNWDLVEQPVKLGLYKNLHYVFKNTDSKYFMWLAGDDTISPDFVAENLFFLENNNNYVASSGTQYYMTKNSIKKGKALNLSGSLNERFINFLQNAEFSHNVFYSVVRREVANQFEDFGKTYAAADWSYDLHLIGAGKIRTEGKSAIYFGTNGISRQLFANNAFASSYLDIILPYLKFSSYLNKFSKEFNLRTLSLFVWKIKLHLAYMYYQLRILKNLYLNADGCKRSPASRN